MVQNFKESLLVLVFCWIIFWTVIDISCFKNESGFCREMEVDSSKNYSNVDDDDDPDAPVQGPINREPDEKLYPDKFKRQSGIKKLLVLISDCKLLFTK